jgi:hypothetical protein
MKARRAVSRICAAAIDRGVIMNEPDVEKIKTILAGLLEDVDRLEDEAEAFPAVAANAARIRAALNMIRINLGGSIFE